MVRTWILLGICFFGSMSFAGPFVSGGIPNTIHCDEQDLSLTLTFLGDSGGGTLTDSTKSLDFRCEAATSSTAGPRGSELVYACKNSDAEISVYWLRTQGLYWAVLSSSEEAISKTISCRH